MAKNPEPVYTRREAMVKEMGFTLEDVPEHGFQHDGLEVVGVYPRHGRVLYAAGAIPTTFIEWSLEQKPRAVAAINGDFYETFGRPMPEP